VTSPDRQSSVQQIICASDSYKFYTPARPSRDAAYNSPTRETPISQELYSVGYYLVTVDGPRVTVTYYGADPNPDTPGLEDLDLTRTPALQFRPRETFGYSLNGREKLVGQGQSYALTDDTTLAVANGETGYLGTTMTILDGHNRSTMTDYSGRALVKSINTGWTPLGTDPHQFSDTLTLWGMNEIGPWESDVNLAGDPYVLTMTYGDASVELLEQGLLALACRDSAGKWSLAAALNGETAHFAGDASYDPALHGLGSYGFDSRDQTVWAVLNRDGVFAARAVPEPTGLALVIASALAAGVITGRHRASRRRSSPAATR
jgi:hypothetical protein